MLKTSEPMSEAMFYILLALFRPLHGYAIVDAVKKLSSDRVSLSCGTLYGILTRMEVEHYIRLCRVEGRKKSYEITDDGKLAVQAEFVRLNRMVSDASFFFLGSACGNIDARPDRAPDGDAKS